MPRLRPAFHELRADRRDPLHGDQEGRQPRAVRAAEAAGGPAEGVREAARQRRRPRGDRGSGRDGAAGETRARDEHGGRGRVRDERAAAARQGRLRPFRVRLPALPRHRRVHDRAERPAERKGMSTLSARAWTLAVALSVLPAVLPADQSLQVAPLSREGRVLVSFRLDNAFNEDIRTAIHSGLTISFIYDVELKRGSSLWFDRTIASEKVTAAVRYDNLARRYQVTRTQDGRIERVDATEREEDARRLLTESDKIPLVRGEGLEHYSLLHHAW